ncbi:unnamed protein product [Strongylus vulgaris]|uniref:SCP domain-containing protein n=1 Tax=Strongylus vulgaris TaxID=40348 RepID=A0A3P7JHR0_STRVU|nr:unnamed protein product [Strongylus vulgaris]
MNMYRMRYDKNLEKDAQKYADSCPTSASQLSTRSNYGENIEVIEDTSISCADAIVQALQSWWNQISVTPVNSKMKYTQVLEQSASAPTKFTQMAWGASYKVGCGVKRCSSGTVVVCRYYVSKDSDNS